MWPCLGLPWPWEVQHESMRAGGQRIKDKLYPLPNLAPVGPIIHFTRKQETREISPLHSITLSNFVMSSVLITFDLHRTLWSYQGQVLFYPFGKQPPAFSSLSFCGGSFLSREEAQGIEQILTEISCQLETRRTFTILSGLYFKNCFTEE